MFCNHCGMQIQPDQRFCSGCGKPATTAAAPTAPAPGTPQGGRIARHLKMLAVFWIALSALNLLRAGGRLVGARFLHTMGRGWLSDFDWGFPGGDFLPFFISILGFFTLLMAAAGFIVGFGLMERRPWARTAGIV